MARSAGGGPAAYTHAAPTPPLPATPLSPGPPTIAVLRSAERATEAPWNEAPAAPVPTSLTPCWVQTPPLRVKTHAPPTPKPLSTGAPTIAVLPSAERETDWPCCPPPVPPVPISLGP